MNLKNSMVALRINREKNNKLIKDSELNKNKNIDNQNMNSQKFNHVCT